MDYSICNDSDKQIINIKVTCLLNQDIRKKILAEIVHLVYSSGFQRVLIDLTESSFNEDEPMTGALELTTHMMTIGISPQTKIAFIFSEAEYHRKYFESVASTTGFNLRYFRDQDAARNWLNQ